MKERIIIVLILIFSSRVCISQDTTYTKFIEVGGGMSYTESIYGAFNGGLTLFTSNYVALFIEYNQFYGYKGVMFHEINMKLGPCYRIKNNTYISFSSGLSYIFNGSSLEEEHVNGSLLPVTTYEDNKFINIPIQVKLNIGIYKNINIGLKGTYNVIITESEENKGTALFYIGYAF